jgi:hypothetical protein
MIDNFEALIKGVNGVIHENGKGAETEEIVKLVLE